MFNELLKHKANKVQKDIRQGKKPDKQYTEVMSKYHTYLKEGSGDRESLYAFNIGKDMVRREMVEALILSEADLEEVETIFGLPQVVMQMYKELFFETDNFFSRLDVISYLENYDEDFGKAIKVRAYNMGAEFLFFKYANIAPKSESQKRLVKQMFMGSAYRAMEANYSNLTSAKTKAATTHAGIMLKCYEAIEKLMDSGNEGNETVVQLLVAKDKAEGLNAKAGEAMAKAGQVGAMPDTKDMI